jgi:UrcA family protein
MLKFAVLSVAAIAAVGVAAPSALAQSTVGEVVVHGHMLRNGAEVRSVVVSYRDLDLSQPEGMDTLYGRVQQAAENVCAPHADARDGADFDDYQRCRGRAIDRAMDEVQGPPPPPQYQGYRDDDPQ